MYDLTMKNNPLCPKCRSKSWRKGKRRGKIKYQCTTCKRWFQVNRTSSSINPKHLLLLHLDGLSFRSLADIYNISVGTAYNYCFQEMKRLPHLADVTRKYSERFCGILLTDGKFIKVKHYERKIPVIYGVDYFSHDIPNYRLALSENYQVCQKFFASIKLLNYPMQAVVCDDNRNIYQAAKYVFPKSITQLCLTHFLEHIRREYDSRKQSLHQEFVRDIEILFEMKRAKLDFDVRARKLVIKYQSNKNYVNTLMNIALKQDKLLAYLTCKGTPQSNNLIECLNSHLQGRLETIKGFESFDHADLWLNAYFLRRRTKKFTDCKGKFRKLNGKTPLEISKRRGIDLPSFF